MITAGTVLKRAEDHWSLATIEIVCCSLQVRHGQWLPHGIAARHPRLKKASLALVGVIEEQRRLKGRLAAKRRRSRQMAFYWRGGASESSRPYCPPRCRPPSKPPHRLAITARGRGPASRDRVLQLVRTIMSSWPGGSCVMPPSSSSARTYSNDWLVVAASLSLFQETSHTGFVREVCNNSTGHPLPTPPEFWSFR